MSRGRKPGERALALRAGSCTYDGSPCRVCRATLRYTCNGACVECANNKPAEEVRERENMGRAREIAAHRGMLRYMNEEPCRHCGGFERYTSSRSCVSCAKARTQQAREVRSALFHSDTSPLVWINEPPSPETAPLYAMCPTLAAYAGEWHVVYTDAQHLSPGARLYPGQDVFRRPAALQAMLNDRTHPGHEIAQHLIPAYYAALRKFNEKVRGIK